jgi:hypothetical protein
MSKDTTPVDLDLDEVRTILSALSEDNVRTPLQRYVRPLETKLEMVERKLVAR